MDIYTALYTHAKIFSYDFPRCELMIIDIISFVNYFFYSIVSFFI